MITDLVIIVLLFAILVKDTPLSARLAKWYYKQECKFRAWRNTFKKEK